MVLSWLKKWSSFALLNGVYCIAALSILQMGQLLVDNTFTLIFSFAAAALLTLLLVILYPLSKRFTSHDLWLPLVLVSYLLSAFLSNLYFSVEREFIFSYYVAFFVMAIFPIVVRLIFTASKAVPFTNEITENKEVDQENTIFKLFSDAGKVVLAVPFQRILYFEASDNYVICYYLDASEKPKKSMNRISMRKIEELLHGNMSIFARIHKSFIINTNYVEGISGRVQSYKLEMMYTDVLLPVSRTYDIQSIKEKLNY